MTGVEIMCAFRAVCIAFPAGLGCKGCGALQRKGGLI